MGGEVEKEEDVGKDRASGQVDLAYLLFCNHRHKSEIQYFLCIVISKR
jgi:hypothetical protein